MPDRLNHWYGCDYRPTRSRPRAGGERFYFQTAQPINYGYQPLFEDRRPRNVGDALTIVLQENVSASKSSSANASRDGRTILASTPYRAICKGCSATPVRMWKPPAATPLTVKVARTPAIPSAER
ncbi:flagellar basal body L-ring protein FlgH [Enterobacter hormaechei]